MDFPRFGNAEGEVPQAFIKRYEEYTVGQKSI